MVSGVGSSEPDHQLGQIMGSDLVGLDRCHGLAVSQDGDRVGDREHLVEFVIDEQNRGAVGFEAPHVAKQLFDFLGNEHRGRLVEDQDLGAAVEHLDDLHSLALPHLEFLDQVVGIDVEPVGLAHLLEVRLGLLEVDLTSALVGSAPRITFSSTVS